jgi:hypothetical protein
MILVNVILIIIFVYITKERTITNPTTTIDMDLMITRTTIITIPTTTTSIIEGTVGLLIRE